MGRGGTFSWWLLRSLLVLFLIFAITSCEKGKPDKKKTDPGKIGSVTLAVPASGTNVQLYAKAELLVTFQTLPSTTAPYDPDPTRGGMDLTATFTGPGGSFVVPGYYDGTNWRIRFSPLSLGTYKYTVSYQDPDSTGTWSEGEIKGIASTTKGFARIQGRYLSMTNGTMIYPVGHNNGWLANVEQPTLAQMASRGENLLAFWHATPWDPAGARAPIENVAGGVGNYNQNACQFIEGLVGRAETANVFLQPTIWSHGELREQPHKWTTGEGWWTNNGYSDICATPADFFVMSLGGAETEQWRLQKNFLRYLFARYGYSRAILNWIVIAELDGTSCFYSLVGGTWVADPILKAQLTAWLQAVRDYWNQMDFYRRNADGKTPLAAFATDWEAIDMGGFLPTLGYEPGLDTVSADTYLRGNNTQAALVGGLETELMRGPGKPCFHGEFGGWAPITTPTAGQISHNGLWAAASAGACMTPLQWCDGSSWVLLTSAGGAAIRDQLQCQAAFMANVDYLGASSITSGQIVTPSLTQSGWSTHTSDRGFGWIQCGLVSISCTINGMTNGSYQIDWYNVAGTAPVLASSVTVNVSGGTLAFTYPGVASDMAFKFIRTGAAAVTSTSSPVAPASTRAMLPPVEGGTPQETEEPPVVTVPSGSEGDGETPPGSDDPVPPPTEF